MPESKRQTRELPPPVGFRAAIFARLHRWALLALTCAVMTGCETNIVIVNDLEEREANEMLVLLNTRGILAEKRENITGSGGTKIVVWNLAVPSGKRFEALAVLNANGLPRRRGQTLLNLFSKQGLVSSEMEEQVRYQAGLADQIANTIRKIDGVLDADVQLSIPQEEVIPGQNKPKSVTASVYIKHSGILDDPNAQLEIKVKRLVSGSIPGLNFDNVTVIGDSIAGRDTVPSLGSPEDLLTRIWGVHIARGSAKAFRGLLFFLLALVAVLGCSLTWLLWKLQEGLISERGRRALFDLAPLKLALTEPDKPAEASAAEPPPSPTAAPATPPPPGAGPLRAPPSRGAK